MRTDRYLFPVHGTPELLVEVLVELDDLDANPARAEVVLLDEVAADLGPRLLMHATWREHRGIVDTALRALRVYDPELRLDGIEAAGIFVHVVPEVDPDELYVDDPPLDVTVSSG